jgi:hypothetical protein
MKKFLIFCAAAFFCVSFAHGQALDQIIADHTRAYRFAEVITPSDSAALPHITKAIYVGTATAGQTIKVDMDQSGTVTLNNVVQGTFLKIAAKKVYATGTTATNLISFF